MAEGLTAGRFILWDVDFVLDWIRRNESYAWMRERSHVGTAALSVQAFAEVLRVVRLRPSTLARLEETIEELNERFALLDLTPDHARAYAAVADACRKTPDLDVANEAWFVWQVALNRHEGHRILTKAPQRYRGLVGPNDLA